MGYDNTHTFPFSVPCRVQTYIKVRCAAPEYDHTPIFFTFHVLLSGNVSKSLLYYGLDAFEDYCGKSAHSDNVLGPFSILFMG
jgi:hypothetical protein